MRKYIKSLDKTLVIILFITVASILLIDLWLIDIPAPHYIIERLGKIYYTICISYLTCFIFHFVVVHIKDVKNKEHINRQVAIEIQNIINTGLGFIESLARFKNYELSESYPTQKDVVYLFSNTNSSEENPEMMDYKASRYLKWYETIYNMLDIHDAAIKDIESNAVYIAPRIICISKRP